MVKAITRIIRKFANSNGYEIVKLKNDDSFKLGKWLEKLNIHTIIDVGSNEGQFVKAINEILPGRKILAFEPIKSCFDKLVANTQGMDIVCYNSGASDENGTTEINISENFESSSILPMETLHKNIYPDSKYVSKQTIDLKRLDDITAGIDMKSNILLKIDVQGYENKVIKGGSETVKKAAIIVIEYSYQPIYEGQWLFDETYRYFTDNGFKFIGILEQAGAARNGVPVWGDAVFVKKDLAKLLYNS